MKRFALPLVALALLIGAGYVVAQTDYPTPQASVISRGTVTQCLNSAGQAIANTAYPCGATPITASATGTTAAVVATLPGVAGKLTYICGFSYQGSDATAAQAGILVISGTISGSLNYAYPTLALGATVPQPPPAGDEYIPCIPASAVNTAIVVTSPALGSGATVATVAAWGFQL